MTRSALLEIHILQNFAPANLNRDDTGAPKECEFGGRRRGRISSQCLKRAIRLHFSRARLLPEENLAHRTKRIVDAIVNRLVESDRVEEDARVVARALITAIGVKMDEDQTSYLLYLGNREIEKLVGLCNAHWEALVGGAGSATTTGGGRTAAQERRARSAALPKELIAQIHEALDGGRAADLALFGRMLADRPDLNRDAASQVAHAISTNALTAELDYFTAVDDFNPAEQTGAGMIGTVEFNSSCFYRYANIDLRQLEANLSCDRDLAVSAATAFVEAAVEAVPTGKQNSMAAHNPPSLAFVVLRERALWNLANAFVRPARVSDDRSLVEASILDLDRHWGEITRMYGRAGIVGGALALGPDVTLRALAEFRVGADPARGELGALIDRTRTLVSESLAAAERASAA